MADVIKRLKYYNGQFLQEPDFTAEQEYHLDRQRRHNRQFHTPGIASGLAVTVGTTSVQVAPGTALDGEGRQVVLAEQRTIGFSPSLNGQWVLVVISYRQEAADDATVGDAGKTRWKEDPLVEAILESGAPSANDRVRLARLQISSTGTIAQQDLSVRTPVGSRLRPEEMLDRLKLSRQGVASVELSSGAANRADVAGSLQVNGDITASGSINATGNLTTAGNILVTGTVDGRDVSADGAKLDNLALSQIEGVLNPGGNIDLVGQNGITIVGSNTAKTITFTGGAPISIDGVSNAGGNIDLVPGGAISIAPDNGTGKKITISETHSALTGNPHGTLASQLADYDFKSVYQDSMYFLESWVDGSTRTFDVGFQPRLIHVHGVAQGRLNGAWHGGTVHGIARIVGSNITQHGAGPFARRDSIAPGVFYSGVFSSGIVAYGSFTDNLANPTISFAVSVKVSSTTSNSVTFMLNRSATTPWFDFWVQFTCFGF